MMVVVLLVATATTTTSEEVGKYVIKFHVVEVLIMTSTTTTLVLLLFVLLNALFARLIVDTTLCRILERLIGVRNLRKLFLGRFRVVLVLVWMVLDSEFLERLLDFLICCIFFHIEKFVVILALGLSLLALLLTATAVAPLCCSEARRSIIGIPRRAHHDKGKSQKSFKVHLSAS